MDIKIIDIFEHDCHLVFQVEHYKDDKFWFLQHYEIRGVEGLKHKRKTNNVGEMLMDDGKVAPYVDDGSGKQVQQLSEGRQWDCHDTPHIDVRSIVRCMLRCHAAHLTEGPPPNIIDVLPNRPTNHNHDMEVGCPILFQTFKHLVGRSYANSVFS